MKSSQAIPKILRIIRLHIVAGGALAFSLGALLAFVNARDHDEKTLETEPVSDL